MGQLAAPYDLMRAVRWHLSHPRTPDTLIVGFESGWRDDAAETKGR